MNDELNNLMQELKEELDNINIKREGIFNNKSNKPYWELEKKYKEKAKKIRENYQKQRGISDMKTIKVYQSAEDTYKDMKLLGKLKYVGETFGAVSLTNNKIYNCVGYDKLLFSFKSKSIRW